MRFTKGKPQKFQAWYVKLTEKDRLQMEKLEHDFLQTDGDEDLRKCFGAADWMQMSVIAKRLEKCDEKELGELTIKAFGFLPANSWQMHLLLEILERLKAI